jgi:hypothetical protein
LEIGNAKNQGLAKSFLVCGIFQWIFQWIFQKKKAAKGWAFEILGNSQNAALDDPLKDSMAGFEVCTPYLQRFSRAWVKVEYPNWT